MDLTPEAKRYFNRVYREARKIAKHKHCRFPPYAVAFKRALARGSAINAMVLYGGTVGPLDPFWRDVFGGSVGNNLRVLRDVHALMARHGAVPDHCQACGTIGPVVIDAAPDGSARGWLCDSCREVTTACGDPNVLHSIADYLTRAIAKQNQATKRRATG